MKTFLTCLVLLLAVSCLAASPRAADHVPGGPTSHFIISGQVSQVEGGHLYMEVNNLTFANSAFFIVTGFQQLNVGFGNYIMVPTPDLITVQVCNGNGEWFASAFFDPGIQAGSHVYFQAWQDVSVRPPAHLWEGSTAADLFVGLHNL